MAGLEIYQEYNVDVAAGEVRRIDTTGTYIRCLSSNIDFAVGVDGDETQFFTGGLKAETIGGERFRFVEIDNRAGGVTLIARLGIGSGELTDSRLTLSGAVVIDVGDNLVSTADVSLAATATNQIVAANTDRRKVIITNLAGNTATLRIGDSSAGAARGTPLAPGATIELVTTDEVQAYNPHGAAQSVAVLEERS